MNVMKNITTILCVMIVTAVLAENASALPDSSYV